MSMVEVITGARLHFGLICGGPDSPNRFGGVGMMVRGPRWVISVRRSGSSCCTAASSEVRERIDGLLPEICRQSGMRGISVAVHAEIPLHRGLGAGTQLTLAVASAARVAAGLPRPADSFGLAAELDRLQRSAVGTFGFDRGGFLIDDGQSADVPGRSLHRLEFPDPWRVVLLIPMGEAGLSGLREQSVFREHRYMSASAVDQQITLIHNSMVPALQNRDFDQFCSSLEQYGRNAGSFFAARQGGVYSSGMVRQLSVAREFKDVPLVQSSWGPAVATFSQSRQQADDLQQRLRRSAFGSGFHCQVVEPLNCGATVRSAAPENSDYVVRG